MRIRRNLISRIKDEAYHLVEEMSLDNFQLCNERTHSKEVRCKFDVEDLTLHIAKMNVIS